MNWWEASSRVMRVVVLLCCGPLRNQLVVEIELRAVHRFGGLLGLPRQLVELCRGVNRRVGQHIARGHPAQRNESGQREDSKAHSDAQRHTVTI